MITDIKTYSLQRYVDRSTRHECPRCHDRHSFTYYVDQYGNIVDRLVGRCNHEVGCGYHYTPREFFRDRPDLHPGKFTMQQTTMPPADRKLCTIPLSVVRKTIGTASNFVDFLADLLTGEQLQRVCDDYMLGAYADRQVIYWQIDSEGRCRTGKIMQYDRATGHRVQTGVNWVYYKMKKQGLLPDDWELTQCLYGEHLLSLDRNKTVIVVESEKTAVIGAAVSPDYVWVACGGISQLSIERCRVLIGRTVLIYPDTDPDGKTFAKWFQKGEDLKKFGCSVIVSDYLERNATPEEKALKIDIGDVMIQELRMGK